MRKFEPSKCYTFDFECNSKEPSHVYMCAIARLSKLQKKYVKMTYSIGETIDYIFSRGTGSRFYAHNLKYDWSFIACYLLKNHAGEFEITKSIIQDLTKSVVTVEVKFRGKLMTFIDTVPIFSAPLAAVLKAFTDEEKGETPLFDYIEDVVITEKEIDYCKVDALGLAKAIIKRMEYGKMSLTTASDAFKVFKDTVDITGAGRFSRFYEPLEVELDDAMRPAYRGGFTYLNPMYQGQILKDVRVIDVNSMYPAQMYYKPLPYGAPKIVKSGEVKTTEIYSLGIQTFTVDSAYLKDGHAPFISAANSMMHSAAYLAEIAADLPIEKRTFSLTMAEYELFKESYHYENLQLLGGFLFKARTDMFKNYIDKYWILKNDPNPTIKTIGKLFLNALYGKFAEGYLKNSYHMYYEDGLKFEKADSELRPCGYLPVGIFITSYARCFLLETINKIGYENFVYTDTDSIHYFQRDGNDAGIHMHPSDLGAWDYENLYVRAFYIRSKRYCGEYIDKQGEIKLKIACAGIKTKNLKEQVKRLEDFQIGKAIKTIEFKQGVNGQYVREKYIKI